MDRDPSSGPSEFSLFVGDLPPEVGDHFLESFFRQYFPSVSSAKVITEGGSSGRSKGYGFVRFRSEAERDKAVQDMNGVFISSRPVRVSVATARRADGGPAAPVGRSAAPDAGAPTMPGEQDPQNTTLFIGGLSTGVSEDELRSAFGHYGEIVYTKIPPGKGCGFVQFLERQAAEVAMNELNGMVIRNSAIRISWGKSVPRSGGSHGRPTTRYGGGGGGGGGYSAAGAPAAAPAYGGYGYDAASYAGYGGYADPYASYAGYGAAAVDPYAAYYGAAAYPQAAHAGATAGAAAGGVQTAAAAAAAQGAPVAIYDPSRPFNLDKANTAFVQRHMAGYTGSYLLNTVAQ